MSWWRRNWNRSYSLIKVKWSHIKNINHSYPPLGCCCFFSEVSLPTFVMCLLCSLVLQAGGRAGEAAAQQQVGGYDSVFYSLLEFNLTLGTKWYKFFNFMTPMCRLSDGFCHCFVIRGPYSLENLMENHKTPRRAEGLKINSPSKLVTLWWLSISFTLLSVNHSSCSLLLLLLSVGD